MSLNLCKLVISLYLGNLVNSVNLGKLFGKRLLNEKLMSIDMWLVNEEVAEFNLYGPALATLGVKQIEKTKRTYKVNTEASLIGNPM